jgi:hypothetical protein
MNAITRSALAACTLGTAVVVAASTSAGTRPAGVREDCSTRSMARFSSRPRDVVVGPMTMVGAGFTSASTVREFGGNKFPLLVAAGHRVTLELPRRARRGAGLAYGPLPQGRELRPRDAHRVVTFVSCPPETDSGSTLDGERVTFWSGAVVVASPRCLPLRIWVDDEPAPRHRTLRLGRRHCRA